MFFQNVFLLVIRNVFFHKFMYAPFYSKNFEKSIRAKLANRG